MTLQTTFRFPSSYPTMASIFDPWLQDSCAIRMPSFRFRSTHSIWMQTRQRCFSGSMPPSEASGALIDELQGPEQFVRSEAAHLLAEQMTEESYRALSRWEGLPKVEEEFRQRYSVHHEISARRSCSAGRSEVFARNGFKCNQYASSHKKGVRRTYGHQGRRVRQADAG